MKLKNILKAPEKATSAGIMPRLKHSMSEAAGEFRKRGIKVVALFIGFFQQAVTCKPIARRLVDV